jgi:hypothetical protein
LDTCWVGSIRAAVYETSTDQLLTKALGSRIEHFVSERMDGYLYCHTTICNYEKWSS